MRTILLTFITLFSLTFILPAYAQDQTSECASASFKQVIEKVDSFNKVLYRFQQRRWAIGKMYTRTTESSGGRFYKFLVTSEEISPELYSDPEYIQIRADEKKVRDAYAGFIIPIIEKSQNIAELFYLYEFSEYDADDSFLIKQVLKNKTFQKFTQSIAAQINYKTSSDSSMVETTVRTPRGYSGFWEKDTMVLEITKTFVLETLKPLTEYSAAEIWWIIRSLAEHEYESNSDAYFTDTISAQTKKVLRAKIKKCWAIEGAYSHSNMFLDPDDE